MSRSPSLEIHRIAETIDCVSRRHASAAFEATDVAVIELGALSELALGNATPLAKRLQQLTELCHYKSPAL